ncbi:type II toxin-antitoxin system RelE/ParE family toxin [archaeon]|nr:type II toxin-antitoxin system RelE/ParE family toxin [archaeon]
MKVLFSKTSEKQLRKLNLRFQEKVIDCLNRFQNGEIVDFKKLKGRHEEYRIRVGEYRILLIKKEDELYLVTDVGKRENIYLIFL